MSVNLGRVGVWTSAFDGQPATRVREAAAELDELGYGAIWFAEAYGREAFTQAGLLLNATERLVVATGIANVFLRDPFAMASGERALAEAFPGRFLLGLGGHRTADQPPGVLPHHGRPVPTVRAYLDAMDRAPLRSPAPAEPSRRVLAALGPRMLELAAERTWGAHPYFVPVEHTAKARETLGADALLAVEQTVILERPDRARELARGFVDGYLGAHHQVANLRRLGFGDDDLVEGGSDRLLEALFAWGDVESVARRVREHLDAGADHVCVQVLGEEPPMRQWRELAPALLEL
ncbi:TIGR03620 family F420-dependent LLM class oxidoreductase [Streptosporangium carneum]|uniref:LLM class F420-dependent oxidoreductase n=1 Tax=Streptosporangium carneum TaxID=47481 RepID=A0A9W6MDJ0_9ACTN|nr:TIGR03620 family F420-dependent LLM class oxidoreductase [Streptosporangium carneum]GLK10211.1 LLM class F420-dependent oxidoreductase [Streptosporangium carneum]